MYGMLLQSIQHYVQEIYGEALWEHVVHSVGCPLAFNAHQIYDDTLIHSIAKICSTIDGTRTEQDFMTYFGRCFVKYFSCFGYQTFVRASGRHFTDFLQNVDNIHLEMRFSYPKMSGPSMYVTSTDVDGSVLIYRSSRSGFKHYLIGQLHEIAETMYSLHLEIVVLEETISSGSYKTNTLVLRLNYDNRAYTINKNKQNETIKKQLRDGEKILRPLSSQVLLNLFPWTVTFGRSMRVLEAGANLLSRFPSSDIYGRSVTNILKIRRPGGLPFTWENITNLQTVMFELELLSVDSSQKLFKRNIVLKGQMKYVSDIETVIYLCSPV